MIVGGQTEARSTIIDYHEPFDQGLKSSTLQKFSQLRSRISTSNLKWLLYIWLLKYKISACPYVMLQLPLTTLIRRLTPL